MSSNDKLSRSTESPEAVSATIASDRRRRLLKGGIAATPVVAILKSRHVLASTSGPLQCRAVSAYLSGSSHLSHHPEGEACLGRTPGYWGTHPNDWPSGFSTGKCTETGGGTCQAWADDGVKMKSVWPSAGSSYANATMMQVIWRGGNSDPQQAGAHLVAAALNNKTGKVSEAILPWGRIVAMGNAILAGQQYQAAPGVWWNGSELVAFLQQTMPL